MAAIQALRRGEVVETTPLGYTHPFPWIPLALAVAVAGGATFCASILPHMLAGPIAGVLALVATVVGWWARAERASPGRPLEPPVVSDSLPPGSELRMRLLESAVVHAHDVGENRA